MPRPPLRRFLPSSPFFVLLLHVLLAAVVRSQDSCYVTDSGHTCCDKALESAMKSAMSGKDLLSSADRIQKSAEGAIGGKFETVVAFDDFAHKSHFKDGKSCKVEKDGQVALAWQP
ncbi:hypothetical protein niasHT_038063 [Heterodera trifolii]|uniref:Ground-like domain-containing protein n=1 Tax=Heterodera trifolii TaxID=157864 RepID=A0ABD2I4L5_9BILA